MLALIASLSVNAIDIKIKKDKTVVDGIFYNVNLKKQQAVVVRGQEAYVGDIVIPEKITVDSVTCYIEEIGSGAFKKTDRRRTCSRNECFNFKTS